MSIHHLSVLIPDGESGHALIVARCLAQIPDLELHILSKDPWAALRFSRRRQMYCPCPAHEGDNRYLDAINQAVKRTHADIILPVEEPAVQFLSLNRHTIAAWAATVPVPSPDIFEVATDKWSLAEFMNKNQIPGPPTILYTADKIFEQSLHELPFPVLAKPTRSDGGKGIRRFENPAEVVHFLRRMSGESPFQYIIQSVVHGYDVDCSVLCKDGRILAHTIQKGFIQRPKSFSAPAGIQFIQDDRVFDVVSRLVSALNWSGIAHIDLRYDNQDNQMKVIEINARYWGSLTGSLIVGVNFPYLSCLAGLNTSFPIPNYRLDRFIEHTTAIRQNVRRLLRKSSLFFNFKETDFGYILADPLAEVVNKLRRWSPYVQRDRTDGRSRV